MFKKTLSLSLLLFISVPLYAATLSNQLVLLQADYKKQVGNSTTVKFKPINSTTQLVEDNRKVVVTITAKNKTTKTVIADLTKKGMTDISQFRNAISGVFPIERLNELTNVKNVTSITSSYAMTKGATNTGIASNSADEAMFTDQVRKQYHVDGSGITIGVISDSYNCLQTAQTDINNGDLPQGVNVLKEYPFCSADSGHDEGRAMMQLIHDIAPNAKLLFYTGFVSAVDMAAGILALRKAGADIIVDDIGWFTTPFFQDGIIAQAVDIVNNGLADPTIPTDKDGKQGVTYFSAAGNMAKQSYEKSFNSQTVPNSKDIAHCFADDCTDRKSFYQRIHIPTGTTVRFVLQWNEAAESALVQDAKGNLLSASSDLDMFLFSANSEGLVGDTVVASSKDVNKGHDPVEFMAYTPKTTKDGTEFYLYISQRSKTAPSYIKYILFAPTGIDAPKTSIGNPMEWDAESKSFLKDGSKPSGGKAYVFMKADKKVQALGTVTVVDDQPTIKYKGNSIVVGGVDDYPVYYVLTDFIPYVQPDGTLVLYPTGTNTNVVEIMDYPTNSGTIFGHSNADGAIAVGAMSYRNTPWFYNTKIDDNNTYNLENNLEVFSSFGGTPIFWDFNPKTYIATKIDSKTRTKPEIIAPDDSDTSFFSAPLTVVDGDNSGFPNFRGTSAAAPNAAAVAALMLQFNPSLTPSEIKAKMMSTAFLSENTEQLEVFTGLCGTNVVASWGTGCGLIQANSIFPSLYNDIVAKNISENVALFPSADKATVKAGDLLNYELTVLNQNEEASETGTLSKILLSLFKIPNATIENVTGCDSVLALSDRFLCRISSLAPQNSITISVSARIDANVSNKGTIKFKARLKATGLTKAIDTTLDTSINASSSSSGASNSSSSSNANSRADLNADSCVDKNDYAVLANAFRSKIYNANYDLTKDGKITIDDLNKLKTLYTHQPDGTICNG